ncbi:hypothetical protein J4558_20900 [Leptolyngbya sp. 15MV]|nr:hypothetical protein J4558_20900 [Leptolyngbya sp. 15MV]
MALRYAAHDEQPQSTSLNPLLIGSRKAHMPAKQQLLILFADTVAVIPNADPHFIQHTTN